MGPNETALRDGYRRFSNGEEACVYEYLSDAVVWQSPGDRERTPTAGERRGAEGVREYFAVRNKEWSIDRFDVRQVMSDNDEHFALRVSCGGRHKRTGTRVQFDKIDYITMKDGKITRFTEFLDTAPLERASGASG